MQHTAKENSNLQLDFIMKPKGATSSLTTTMTQALLHPNLRQTLPGFCRQFILI